MVRLSNDSFQCICNTRAPTPDPGFESPVDTYGSITKPHVTFEEKTTHERNMEAVVSDMLASYIQRSPEDDRPVVIMTCGMAGSLTS
jgi:hypothetical protein